eukprot:1139617-Pelagomonas_calceolata.AAC.12
MSEANQAVPPELAAMARQGAGGGGGGSRGGYGGSRGYGGGRGGGREIARAIKQFLHGLHVCQLSHNARTMARLGRVG